MLPDYVPFYYFQNKSFVYVWLPLALWSSCFLWYVHGSRFWSSKAWSCSTNPLWGYIYVFYCEHNTRLCSKTTENTPPSQLLSLPLTLFGLLTSLVPLRVTPLMSLREETMSLFVVVFLCFFSSPAALQTEPVADPWYVAAVYEHNLILNPEPHMPLSRPAALQHLQKNLDVYEEQAARAAQQVCSRQEISVGFSSQRNCVLLNLGIIENLQNEQLCPQRSLTHEATWNFKLVTVWQTLSYIVTFFLDCFCPSQASLHCCSFVTLSVTSLWLLAC